LGTPPPGPWPTARCRRGLPPGGGPPAAVPPRAVAAPRGPPPPRADRGAPRRPCRRGRERERGGGGGVHSKAPSSGAPPAPARRPQRRVRARAAGGHRRPRRPRAGRQPHGGRRRRPPPPPAARAHPRAGGRPRAPWPAVTRQRRVGGGWAGVTRAPSAPSAWRPTRPADGGWPTRRPRRRPGAAARQRRVCGPRVGRRWPRVRWRQTHRGLAAVAVAAAATAAAGARVPHQPRASGTASHGRETHTQGRANPRWARGRSVGQGTAKREKNAKKKAEHFNNISKDSQPKNHTTTCYPNWMINRHFSANQPISMEYDQPVAHHLVFAVEWALPC